MKINRICVLGGTGYVGRHLVAQLTAKGYETVIPSRHPQRFRQLGVNPGCQVVEADIFDKNHLARVLMGCDAVVNLVGILNERRRHDFRKVHIELVDKVGSACRQAGIKRLLHMSALNADAASGSSVYLRSKGEGENRAHTSGKPDVAVTSFRPSVIFGEDDSFINRFAGLMKIPGPMPLACPGSKFAPVYVEDVCQAMVNSLEERSTFGQRYDLCGPQVYSLKQIVEYIAAQLGKQKLLIGMPDSLSRLQGIVLGHLPGKVFTEDNYLSLQQDSVCPEGTKGLTLLGITATHMDSIVPAFLKGQSEKNRYMEIRGIYKD